MAVNVSGNFTVKRFVATFWEFPDLSFEVWIEQVDSERIKYRVMVGALGDLQNRDVWQKSFDQWCGSQGLSPKFRRGNVRTNRTLARVVFFGSHPIVDFIVRWIGFDALPLGHVTGSRVGELEAQIALLRKQNAELLRSAKRGREARREQVQ